MTIAIPQCYYRISVKALIHNSDGKFLLVQEENGLWELPGGGLDHGEEGADCMKREIKEEMGLNVISMNDVPSYFYTTKSLKGAPVANVLYEVEVENLDFTPSEECKAIGFFTLDEAKSLDLYPNIKEFLRHYNPKNHV